MEGTATRALRDCDRHSTKNVMSAMTVTKPSMLRLPKIPWMGPPTARSPWMPRKTKGMSSSTPERISSARESASRARSVSPSARTVCSVSRIWPTVIASSAKHRSSSQPRKESLLSVVHTRLTSAHARNASREEGAIRRADSSARRTHRMPRPSRQRPPMIVASVTRDVIRSTRYDPKTAARTAMVKARANSAEPSSRPRRRPGVTEPAALSRRARSPVRAHRRRRAAPP